MAVLNFGRILAFATTRVLLGEWVFTTLYFAFSFVLSLFISPYDVFHLTIIVLIVHTLKLNFK